MTKVITTRKEWRTFYLISFLVRALWIILILGVFLGTYILEGQKEKCLKLLLSGVFMALAGVLMIFFAGMVGKRNKESIIADEVADLAIITGNSAITAFMVITGFIIAVLFEPFEFMIENFFVGVFSGIVMVGGLFIGLIIPRKTEIFLRPIWRKFFSEHYEGTRQWVLRSHWYNLTIFIIAISLIAALT